MEIIDEHHSSQVAKSENHISRCALQSGVENIVIFGCECFHRLTIGRTLVVRGQSFVVRSSTTVFKISSGVSEAGSFLFLQTTHGEVMYSFAMHINQFQPPHI